MLYEVLENGIEVGIKENHQSKAVSVQCWVRAGSLHENEKERGMAHFIEHMLFKGTENRGVGEIGKTVESSGGDINAYTTFDRTVFYLTLMSKYSELGVELLSDAIFNSTFDADELESEKGVVLEEIKRGLDDPGGKVGREIFSQCYQGTEAGRPVIGNPESVKSFTRESVKKFHQKWYQPENMSVVVVGDFCKFEMLDIVKKYFGSEKSAKVPSIEWPKSNFPKKPQVTLIKDDFNLPKLEIVLKAPYADHEDMVALDMVSFVLGTGSGSRLNKNIREKEKTVVAAGASCFTPAFDGIFAISAYAPEENYLTAIGQITKELIALKTTNPITEEELVRAKVNLQSDHIYRDETVDGQSRSIGHSMMTEQKLFYEDVYSSIVENMTPDLINGAISRWFDLNSAVIVGLVPKESEITESQILDSYNNVISANSGGKLSKAPNVKTAKKSNTLTDSSEITVTKISEGIELVYKKIEDSKLFALTASTEGGSRAETALNSGEQSAIFQMITLETKNVSYDQMVEKVEGLGASLSGFSGKDSLGLNLHCLSKDAKDLGSLFVDCLLKPVFPKDHWDLQENELKEIFASQNDSPSSICLRKFQEKLFGDHPYSRPSYGTEESTAKFNESTLCDSFEAHVKKGPWTFSAVGSLEPKEMSDWLSEQLSGFRTDGAKRKFSSEKILPKPGATGMDYFHKDREQSHIAFGYLGIDWYDEQRAALDVLINILGGHGGRLFMNLREKKSLAYTVAPVVSYGCHPGVVASYIACAPGKSAEALKAMKAEFEDLKEKEPSQDEVERAINYIVGSHEMGLQKTDSQAMTMALMQTYGIGYDDFKAYPKKIETITAADVKKVALRLFEGEGYSVLVGPNEI